MLYKKMNYSDDTAIKALNNGDGKAFTWIYNKYFHSLCCHAEKIVECLETAADIVQDLFVKLWENREKIDITTSLGAYLYGSIRNSCLKHIAHIHVQHEYHNSFGDENSDYDSNNPMSILIAKETERAIEHAINALPEQYRQIIELMRLKEFSYEEIAEKLNIPVGSVGPQLNLARKKLMKSLENKV